MEELLEGVNARVVAITTDAPAKNNRIAKRLDLTIPILSDGDGTELKKLGLWDPRWNIAAYGFYLLDRQLGVIAHFRGIWHADKETVHRFVELFKGAS